MMKRYENKYVLPKGAMEFYKELTGIQNGEEAFRKFYDLCHKYYVQPDDFIGAVNRGVYTIASVSARIMNGEQFPLSISEPSEE